MKPLLVGEANPYGPDPYYALFPEPEGSAGDRLCRMVMGLSRSEYLTRFDRINLCARRWTLGEARGAVARIKRLRPHGQVTVLLGAKVCAAFDVGFRPFTALGDWSVGQGTRAPVYVVLPHPSGRSRGWSVSGSYDRARKLLRAAGVLPP